MRKRFRTAAAIAMGLAAMVSATNAHSAEIRVLIGGAMVGVFAELRPQFEKASGHKLDIFAGATPELIKEAVSGKPFDAAVVPVDVMKDADARARFNPAPTVDVARVGFGVAVRAGSPKPDLGSTEAFRQAMLQAKSITFLPASAAGSQVLRVFDRLGIADAMKAKTVVQTAPAQIAQAVARGDAELAVFLTNVLIAPGVELAGPFPPELQQDLVFTSALAAGAKEPDAAKALLAYLKTPAAQDIIKAKGMKPG
jgi:molybdate transport system substrate-binding protein